MELYFELSRMTFRVILPYPVEIQNSFAKFTLSNAPVHYDAEIEFIQGCDQWGNFSAPLLCEDDQMIFYAHGSQILCAARGGLYGPMAYTVCDLVSSRLVCYMNTTHYPPLQTLGALIQLIPLKWFLSQNGVMLFHASLIAADAKGILFTAPSGAGKTTQARLWAHHRGAEILCNDRVLMRGMRTYGFPYDGADPVFNPKEHGLHAIVCLGQSPRNEITRLRPAAAIARLMHTVLFDAWDAQVQDFVSDQLLHIVSQIPVYQLDCSPDEAAVLCLEDQLRKDGVIK